MCKNENKTTVHFLLLTCHFLRIIKVFNLSVHIFTLLKLSLTSVSHLDSKHCWAVKRFSLRRTSKLDIKSLASSETASNASSSKSYSPQLIFVNVSTSESPINGERPDNLWKTDFIELVVKQYCLAKISGDIQYITNYTDAPHISLEANRFIVDNFWWNEFWCTEHDSNRSGGGYSLRKTKIDYFYLDYAEKESIFVQII